MDLRSIVNAEDTPDARKLPASSLPQEESRPRPVAYSPRGVGGPIYEKRMLTDLEHQQTSLPHPPPLRTSSSYNDPYPQSGSPMISARAIQNPYPVMRRKDPNRPSRSERFCGKLKESSLANTEHPGQHSYRERGSTSSSQGHHSYGQSTPLAHTPTRSSPSSAGAPSTFQRPTSSHSVATPGSAQHHPSSLTQRSPQPSNTHVRLPSQPQLSQQYSSQPHTPLGPPPYGRHANRESPTAHGHERTLSGGSYSQQHAVEPPANLDKSPIAYASRPPQPERLLSADLRGREQSLSVSPKTTIGRLPGPFAPKADSPHVRVPSEQKASAQRRANDASLDHSSINEPQMTPITRRSTSNFAIDGLLNEAPANDRTMKSEVGLNRRPSSRDFGRGSGSAQESPKPTELTGLEGHRPSLPNHNSTQATSTHQNTNSVRPLTNTLEEIKYSDVAMEDVIGDSSSRSIKVEALDNDADRTTAFHSSQGGGQEEIPTQKSEPSRKKQRREDASETQKSAAASIRPSQLLVSETSRTPPQATKKKRRREIPIFAQSVRSLNRPVNGKAMLPNQAPTGMGHSTPVNGAGPTAFHAAHQQIAVKQEPNGSAPTNGTHVPVAQPDNITSNGPLGPWEASILNIIPSEDVTRVVADWLFNEVVVRDSVGVGPAGVAAGQGAVLEIEAKIGTLVDRNTNCRLGLPVMTETVVSQTDPNMRIAFESNMTETQHKALNAFLNDATKRSMAPKRIPIKYKRTNEIDTFFELTQKGQLALPAAITANFSKMHRGKTTVRVTTDQKTGQELAKIVKARVADIDVYSPNTMFDYRISVNVEMNFEGSMQDLIEPDRSHGRKPDRYKNRLSYSHLAYQIDLTLVAPTEGAEKKGKEHELEIEVSSEEVRRQGKLAQGGQVNEYTELVKGFLDNVRLLARHCQPTAH